MVSHYIQMSYVEDAGLMEEVMDGIGADELELNGDKEEYDDDLYEYGEYLHGYYSDSYGS